MDSPSLSHKSAHLAWCASVALHIAILDGQIGSEGHENVFLTRWLACALKQRRFPKEVAPDIRWLLNQGRRLGVRAELRKKVDYLWSSCTGDLLKQADLFRLTYALELAKSQQWLYRLLAEREWSGRHAVRFNPDICGIYLSKGFEGHPCRKPR